MPQIISFADYPIVKASDYPLSDYIQMDNPRSGQINLDEIELQLNKMFPDKQFLSIEEFSKFFSVCYETIRKRVSSGEIKYIKFGKKKVIPKSEIIRLINQGGL